MAKKSNRRKSTRKRGVPKKFSNAGKSFVRRIEPDMNKSLLRSFSAFPRGVVFDGQDEGEHIVLLVRQHIAVFLPKIFVALSFIFLPPLFFTVLGSFGDSISLGFAFNMGVSIVFFLIGITFLVDLFFKWFFSVNIITDERVVDVDFSNVLVHRVSEAQLEKIEDVSHTHKGVLGTMFDFGTVFIQTAAANPEFDFNNVPRPRDVQDTLLDMLELKQSKGK